jgi:hypothetical protein
MYINTSDAGSAEVVKLPMLSGCSQAGDAVRKSGWRCGQEVRLAMRSGSQAGDAVRKSSWRCGQEVRLLMWSEYRWVRIRYQTEIYTVQIIYFTISA